MVVAQRRSRPSLRARAYLRRARRILRATPLFDAAYYRCRWPDVAESGMEAAQHYLLHGAMEGRDPSPLFDGTFYAQSNPELNLTATNPLVHYILRGAREGRNPHPLFDTSYYLRANPEVAGSGQNELEHFILHGADQRRDPHPLFDTCFYVRKAPRLASEMNPLVHYLLYGASEGHDPHPLFDTAYYLETNPDVAAAGMNPLVHFVLHGGIEGRSPHPLFDSAFYLQANPEVAVGGINPLVHYLEQGARPRSGLPTRVDGVLREEVGGEVLKESEADDEGQCSPKTVVLGRFYQLSGLGENARSVLRSLNHVGIPCQALNTRAPEGGAESEFRVLCGGQEAQRLGAVNIFLQNADEVDYWLATLDRPPEPSYDIVCPMWELPRYPPEWAKELDRFDEIWLISRFTYEAVSKAVSKPCFLLPLATEVGPTPIRGKDRFGIDSDTFTFLFAFDLSGIVERKNPLAVIEAFRRLRQRRPQARISLLLKVHDSHKRLTVPGELVRYTAEETEGVVLVDETLSPSEMRGLVQGADCFISLHRSEGFGRCLAEAMYDGKPVIATGHSGNMQFMNPDNSALVGYDLVPVAEGAYPWWRGQVWAEPDIDHAVWHMTRFLDDPSAAATLGARAARDMQASYSYRAAGRRMEARLAAIRPRWFGQS